MRVNPKDVAFFIPPGLKKFKLDLFERIANHIKVLGGTVVRHDFDAVAKLPDEVIPIVGCSHELYATVADWRSRGRQWIYWDRGYLRRVFATWLPRGSAIGIKWGYYRWTVNNFQMQKIRDVPPDRWNFLRLKDCVKPWNKDGDHIVIIGTLPEYWKFHSLPTDWPQATAERISRITKRRIVIRDNKTEVPLYYELKNAHALVTHGSVAAVESVVMGCPVFVDPSSAAAIMGHTDFSLIEQPIYPDRQAWLNSLAYCQYNEAELVDGTLWRLME